MEEYDQSIPPLSMTILVRKTSGDTKERREEAEDSRRYILQKQDGSRKSIYSTERTRNTMKKSRVGNGTLNNFSTKENETMMMIKSLSFRSKKKKKKKKKEKMKRRRSKPRSCSSGDSNMVNHNDDFLVGNATLKSMLKNDGSAHTGFSLSPYSLQVDSSLGESPDKRNEEHKTKRRKSKGEIALAKLILEVEQILAESKNNNNSNSSSRTIISSAAPTITTVDDDDGEDSIGEYNTYNNDSGRTIVNLSNFLLDIPSKRKKKKRNERKNKKNRNGKKTRKRNKNENNNEEL